MHERQASVDRQTQGRMDLGGGQVDALLSPEIVFGPSNFF